MRVLFFLLLCAACLAPLWALRRWAERESLPVDRRWAHRYARRVQPREWDVPGRDYAL